MFLYLHIYALVWILFSSNMLQTLPAINGHKRFYFELKPWIMETKHGLFLNRCMQTVVWIVSTHLQLELIFNMPVVLWSCFSMSYIFNSRWERPCSWGGQDVPKRATVSQRLSFQISLGTRKILGIQQPRSRWSPCTWHSWGKGIRFHHQSQGIWMGTCS